MNDTADHDIPRRATGRRGLLLGAVASAGITAGLGWRAGEGRASSRACSRFRHVIWRMRQSAGSPYRRRTPDGAAAAPSSSPTTAPGICTAAIPVALHRGYYAKHNLEVEFVQLAGSTDQMLQALVTDKADAGGSMLLNWLKPLEQGFDVKLTTGLHGGCTRLLVRRDAGYTDVAQLKGEDDWRLQHLGLAATLLRHPPVQERRRPGQRGQLARVSSRPVGGGTAARRDPGAG